jgi:hypothetical protein
VPENGQPKFDSIMAFRDLNSIRYAIQVKGKSMNRRQAIGAIFTGSAVASVLRPGRLLAQETGTKAIAAEGNTIYLHPAAGVDTNSGSKDKPLRTLAEAARRVNQSTGAGPMTVVLSEGMYAVGETTLIKPERRTFSKTERLTIRAEVLPDDPEWNTGRMPSLIHTCPFHRRGTDGPTVSVGRRTAR